MKKGIIIALSMVIAFVFLQSLPFKFTNSLETQHIFGELGEWSGLTWFGNYGGYIIGVAELIASLLLLVPIILSFTDKSPSTQQQTTRERLHIIGATLAFAIMTGAITFHLFTPLGIVMPRFDPQTGAQIGDDSGILFIMACITWICASALITMDLKKEEQSHLKQMTGKA